MVDNSIIAQPSNSIKDDILHLLRRGKRNAQTGKELAKLLGFNDDRIIRQAIRELIANGIPIASSVQKPYGYFIAESFQEAKEYMSVLKSRLVEDAYRRRDFKQAAQSVLKPEQLILL